MCVIAACPHHLLRLIVQRCSIAASVLVSSPEAGFASRPDAMQAGRKVQTGGVQRTCRERPASNYAGVSVEEQRW